MKQVMIIIGFFCAFLPLAFSAGNDGSVIRCHGQNSPLCDATDFNRDSRPCFVGNIHIAIQTINAGAFSWNDSVVPAILGDAKMNNMNGITAELSLHGNDGHRLVNIPACNSNF